MHYKSVIKKKSKFNFTSYHLMLVIYKFLKCILIYITILYNTLRDLNMIQYFFRINQVFITQFLNPIYTNFVDLKVTYDSIRNSNPALWQKTNIYALHTFMYLFFFFGRIFLSEVKKVVLR